MCARHKEEKAHKDWEAVQEQKQLIKSSERNTGVALNWQETESVTSSKCTFKRMIENILCIIGTERFSSLKKGRKLFRLANSEIQAYTVEICQTQGVGHNTENTPHNMIEAVT